MLNRVVSLMLGTTQRKEEQWLAALLETWKVDAACLSLFFFSSRRRHTRFDCDWSSDVCSSDLRYMGWTDAADLVIRSLEKTIQSRVVTYDFARLMEGAKEVKCSEFGTAIIENMAKL